LRGSPTWVQPTRQFRAPGVPREVGPGLRRPWRRGSAWSNIVLSTAVHRAGTKDPQWAAGSARDPHDTRTHESLTRAQRTPAN
jgi:hypothetical protein